MQFEFRSVDEKQFDFWIEDIDGQPLQPSECDIIGYRYGLNEVSTNCSERDDHSLYSDYVYEASSAITPQAQLACADAHDWQKDQTKRCNAYFQFGRFFVGASLNRNDPEKWPQISAALSRVMSENFVILDAPG